MQKKDIEKPIEKKQKTTLEAVHSDASAPAGQPGPHKAYKAGGKESRVRHILSVNNNWMFISFSNSNLLPPAPREYQSRG